MNSQPKAKRTHRDRSRDLLRIAASACALISILALASCSDPTLKQIAKFEADLNAACSTTFTVVAGAAAQNPPLISTADATSIIGTLTLIEQANRQAETATGQISQLSAADQTNLLAILAPIETAVNNAVANGTTGIKDPATKTKVQTALATIQALLNGGIAIIKAAKT